MAHDHRAPLQACSDRQFLKMAQVGRSFLVNKGPLRDGGAIGSLIVASFGASSKLVGPMESPQLRVASRRRQRDSAGRFAPCISFALILAVLCLLWSSSGVGGEHAARPGPERRRAACEAEARGAVACRRFPAGFAVVRAGVVWGRAQSGGELGDPPSRDMRLRGGGAKGRDLSFEQIDPRMLVREEDGAAPLLLTCKAGGSPKSLNP